MAPSKNSRECEKQYGDCDEFSAEGTEHSAECLTYKTRALVCRNHRACVEVNAPGSQNDKSRKRTDYDCVGKNLEDSPHALLNRFLNVGA